MQTLEYARTCGGLSAGANRGKGQKYRTSSLSLRFNIRVPALNSIIKHNSVFMPLIHSGKAKAASQELTQQDVDGGEGRRVPDLSPPFRFTTRSRIKHKRTSTYGTFKHLLAPHSSVG